MSKVKMYKVTRADGSASHGGSGVWELPKGNKPGKWMPKVKGPKACTRGYHLVTADQLLPWLNAEGLIVWEADGRGAKDEQNDKTAFAEARLIRIVGKWNDRTARLFACDCAEHVLHFFEKERPNDDRPRKAIDAARAFALGKIDSAARAAARAAAWDAADAAWAAAWDAAWAAAWAAERKYQTRRLFYWLRRSVK